MKSSYWIKLYQEILHDPKMGRLSDRLWRRTIEFFLLAGERRNEGALPPVEDMSWTLRTTPAELETDLQELAKVNVVSEADSIWTVTKFTERQAPVPSTKRSQQHRASKTQHGVGIPPQRNVATNETEVGRSSSGSSPSISASGSDSVSDSDSQVVEDEEEERTAGAVFLQVRGGAVNNLDIDALGNLIDECEEHRTNLPRGSPGADASGDDWVKAAILEGNASRNQGKLISLNYISAILDRWQAEGFRAKWKGKDNEDTVRGL